MSDKYRKIKRRFDGWKKDSYDPRDHHFLESENFAKRKVLAFDPIFSLRSKMPAIWDQGGEGSCTAFANDALIGADMIRLNLPTFEPSHQFTYYNTRVLEHDAYKDAGAMGRDVLRAYSYFGYCDAKTYPYVETQVTKRPPYAAYQEGMKHLVKPVAYARVAQNLDALRTAILSGYPVAFGMECYAQIDSDQAAKDGIIKLPQAGEQPIGGHEVALIGWDDTKQMFEFRNSWGANWGVAGNGWLPYGLVLNTQISSDFWVLTTL